MDATFIKRLLRHTADVMAENRTLLIEMDGKVGDSDLGLTMSDGFCAASVAIAESDEPDIGKLLYAAGKAMASAAPSTMGTLMASGLMAAGKKMRGQTELGQTGLQELWLAYEEGVATRGKAQVGEKTFLDGLHPAGQALGKAGSPAQTAREAREAAMGGYKGTQGMLARHGRAAIRGEASRQFLDPGAYVAVLLMDALVRATTA